MKRLTSSICAGALSVALVASGFVPAMAAPVMVTPATPNAPIIQVQGPQDWRNRHTRAQRPAVRGRQMDRGPRHGDRRGFHRRGDRAYYGPHRGFRHQRPGYRYHQGWWFPPAAFIAGAIIGSTATRGTTALPSAHVQWCYDRYRSYRASDNTFQPYQGPRRPCRSPYG